MPIALSIQLPNELWKQKYNAISSTQLHALGEKKYTVNGVFQYVEFDEAVQGAAGMACYWVDKNPLNGKVSCDVSENGGAEAVFAGILMAALSDGKFGWILKEGPVTLSNDILNTVAAANATADCPVNPSPAIGDRVIPAADTDGRFAYLLVEEGDSDAQDVASLEASIEKMTVNLPRVCGIVTALTSGAPTIMLKVQDW